MRLTPYEQKTIRDVAEAYFGEGCVVRLFGSRVDDSRNGGDIDLHLEPRCAEDATLEREMAFLGALRDALGDQKVDVVVKSPGRQPRPIDRIAVSEGIRL